MKSLSAKRNCTKEMASPKEKMTTLLCTCSCFSKESLFMDTPDPSGNTDMP
jgi:L-fucose isomerase-like protein